MKVQIVQDPDDAQVKIVLRSEIETLENNYKMLQNYVKGGQYDSLEIVGAIQVFKETLSRLSGHILTLYVLKGQKTKITWEPLLDNINNALESMRSTTHPNPRAAIELAFSMSEPNAQEVMEYLSKLKAAL